MAYTINLTDGSTFATIADGTINNNSSMVLVGKNYAGYGEFLDENFIHLLENSSNTTAPPSPLVGQLWWNKTLDVMQVFNGTVWKTLGSATSSPTITPPSDPVSGDLWFDTTKNQLFVYTTTPSAGWILVGPASSSGQGVTGPEVETYSDGSTSYDVIALYSDDDLVAIVSSSQFNPSPPIAGFTPTIYPGIQLSTAIANIQFTGTVENATTLDGVPAADFMRADQSTGTVGNLTALNISVSTGSVTLGSIVNANANGAGNIGSSTGYFNTVFAKATSAQYADVAERFAADQEYAPGTVVELGGVAEITKAQDELSENVFGVISTQAAYLMNSAAGTDATHPPIAMTGRVPVRVVGMVRKGDRLVSAGNGLARAAKRGEATAFNVIGRALENKDTLEEGSVEAIVATK